MIASVLPVATIAAGLATLSGCGENTVEHSFPVEIEALDDSGSPVGLVQARAGTQTLGHTGTDGRLAAGILGRDGQRRSVLIVPPPTHRLLSPARISFPLQLATALGGDRAEPQPIRVRIRLEPEHRRYAVLVLTDGRSDLPVMVAARLAGRTDAWGVAQALHVGAPHQLLEVRLDTGADPRLHPSNPSRVFDLPNRDAVLLFQQSFRIERPPGSRTRRGKRSRLRRLGRRQ